MVTITLRNRLRRPVVLHVPELGRVRHAIGTNERDGKTGITGRRVHQRDLPPALTLWARGTPGDAIEGLPAAVAKSVEVAWARGRGDIDVVVVESKDEEKQASVPVVESKEAEKAPPTVPVVESKEPEKAHPTIPEKGPTTTVAQAEQHPAPVKPPATPAPGKE